MIVGIFGDSFAVGANPKSWSNILASTYSYQILNFAQGSTSLFWSYKKLINHIDQVDTIVFVVTSPGRLYHPHMHLLGTLRTVDRMLSQSGKGKHGWNNEKLSPDNIEIFKAAKSYYLNLADYEFDMFVHTQLIKAIQELCQQKNKKLIMIPGFDQNIAYQSIFSCAIFQITLEEIYATFNDKMFRFETAERANHMSQENNQRLAKIINGILKNELTSVNIDMFEFKKETNPALYWEL
jgi:uncharacterized protein YaaR (DUF327 family)